MGGSDEKPFGHRRNHDLRDRAGSGERLRPEPCDPPRVTSSRYRLTTPGPVERVKVPDVTVRRTADSAPPSRPVTPMPAPAATRAQESAQRIAGTDPKTTQARRDADSQATSSQGPAVPPSPRHQTPPEHTRSRTLPPLGLRATPPSTPAAKRDSQRARQRITQSLSVANAAAQRVIDRATAAQEPGASQVEQPDPRSRTSAPPERSGVFADRKVRRREDTIQGVGLPERAKDGSADS